VEIELYPAGTPFVPGRELFLDTTQVSSLPLTTSYGLLSEDADDSQILCRLSGRQIRSLTRKFGRVVALHPLDEMTSFPFVLVRVDRSTEGQALYSPENLFQDVPTVDILFEELPFNNQETIPLAPSPASRQDEFSLPSSPVELADWEMDGIKPLIPLSLSSSSMEVESVQVDVPDMTFVNRSSTGRKRRRVENSVPNAFRAGTYDY